MAIAVLSQSPVMETESQNQSYERISWGIDYQLMRFLLCALGRGPSGGRADRNDAGKHSEQ